MTCQLCCRLLWMKIVLLSFLYMPCAAEQLHYTDDIPDSSHGKAVLTHNVSSMSESAVRSIFAKYGRNDSLSFEGFERLLEHLGLGDIVEHHHSFEGLGSVPKHEDEDHSDSEHDHVHHHEDVDESHDQHRHFDSPANCTDCHSPVCLTADELFSRAGFSHDHHHISADKFMNICPSLLLQLECHFCKHLNHRHGDHSKHSHDVAEERPRWQSAPVWGFSILACVIISAVGLVAVAIIPVMHKVIYNHLLQFLVALAIGSLTGDAMLHLLPHALTEHDSHDHHHALHDRRPVWFGLTALAGIYLFFVVERVVGLCSERKRTQNEQRMKMRELEETATSVTNTSLLANSAVSQLDPAVAGDAAVMASSLPRRLNDAKNGTNRLSRHTDAATSCEEILMTVHTSKDVRKLADDAHDEVHKNCDPKLKDDTWGPHGNGGHNHSHNVPGSVAAVAWMVIVGDGFHNFADGLAIGSAFASSLTGGLSTSIAVFCHELPHELGDFAMLLNAGMSAKQALVYNCVSSLLCMMGMVFGVAIGNISSATLWIFALIAGLFLYVALVDMLPEMTSVGPKKGEHPLLHLALQNSGMLVGATIMLVIALYEHQLQNAFSHLTVQHHQLPVATTAVP